MKCNCTEGRGQKIQRGGRELRGTRFLVSDRENSGKMLKLIGQHIKLTILFKDFYILNIINIINVIIVVTKKLKIKCD